MSKGKIFWFHYNKPASIKNGKPQISCHYNRTCFIVDNIDIGVPTKGELRKIQPYFVIKGKCTSFEIVDNIAIIR
jgi:hypothetical protein